MPVKTNTYDLEYFRQGGFYSTESDSRRFLTLDYNLESYIGVVGVGIISGWQIEQVSGLMIRVLPGKGIINGFFMESPYTIKQRSDMVDGDREVEVIPDVDGVPESNLTTAQRTEYIRVVRLYDSSYDPSGDIENSYVKVVVPTELTLSNNTDNYIFAQRPSGTLPYPPLADYPPLPGVPPTRSDYDTYNDYKAALDIYNEKIEAIQDYDWQTSSANHFTAVEFINRSNSVASSSRILLGNAITRSSTVSSISTSGVNSLANLESQINRFGREFISGHRHGGSKFYDPPKIKLKTDIRNSILTSYNEDNLEAVYTVLSNKETSIELGHKHTYDIDENGDGNTVDKIGSGNTHFHSVITSQVQTPQESVETVESHTHTIVDESEENVWEPDDQYIVYVNDVAVGDETTTSVTADSTKNIITFYGGRSVGYNTYSVTYEVLTEPHIFTSKATNVFRFMLAAIKDFYQNFSGKIDYNDSTSAESDPFWFPSTDLTSVAGLNDLREQSEIAQVLLTQDGDKFMFTPDAARNIVLTLVDAAKKDIVKIEILGEVEVTGTLSTDNILYINADKIILGEFSAAVIPFISHIGRIEEELLAFGYPIISGDGSIFDVSPGITDVVLGHYHNLLLDRSGDGATTDVMVGDEKVYYTTGTEGQSYFIAHAHSSQDYILENADSDGLGEWQTDITGSNVSSSTHTHEVVFSVRGDHKSVYSVKEDSTGNLYAGTSDGLMMIPSLDAYIFVLNDKRFYLNGSDLWTLLNEASSQYEQETDIPFVITEAAYRTEITAAEESLVDDKDSVFINGVNNPARGQDTVMIQKVSSYQVPDFRQAVTKKESEMTGDESITGETIAATSTNGILSETVLAQRDFNDVPIWSLEIKFIEEPSETYVSSTTHTDILAVGSDLIAKSRDINQNNNQSWNAVDTPVFVGINRKVFKATNGDYWLATNNGLLVSRSYNEGNSFIIVPLPGGNPDIKDVIEGNNDEIYSASAVGIFKTTNGGKTWTKVLDVTNGFKQLVRDYSLDRSSTVDGHYHMVEVDIEGNGFLGESIGSGTTHVHQVTSWEIAVTLAHTHSIVPTLYAVDNNKKIWKTTDNGTTWADTADLPDGECGYVIAAFNELFVSKSDGLYKYVSGSWTNVLSQKVLSYNWDYELAAVYLGCEGSIYRILDDELFDLIYQFEGVSSAVLLENDNRTYFEYAYNNASKTFHFINTTLTEDQILSMVDFGKWYAVNGSWDASSPYDIFIDYKRVLSTKFDEDKRETYGYKFSVDSTNGLIDFSLSSSLKEAVEVYDDTITVESGEGFTVGDRIYIDSDYTELNIAYPNRSDFAINVSESESAQYLLLTGEEIETQYRISDYQKALNNYYSEIEDISEMFMYAVVTGINGNELTIDRRSVREIKVPGVVYKIVDLNGDSNVMINIYESPLSFSGDNTHEQVEDTLSNFSDGRPYKFNDTYLSNVLQLTQAIRYVYPDINSEFKNDMFYDFHYQSATNPDYPDIDEYIDVLSSEIYNQKIYDSNFVGKVGRSVNDILIGYGNFAGKIIVATDVGIFWATIQNDWEFNWFFVVDMAFIVNSLMIFGGDRLIAATERGTYYSDDLETWTLEASNVMDYISYGLRLRWDEQEDIVTVSAHTASFSNYDPSEASSSSSESSDEETEIIRNKGYITASSGIPYNVLAINKGIKITGAGTKNGTYIIEKIRDAGDGYGSQIVVSPSFGGVAETKDDVVIVMGEWWKRWDGEDNVSNPNLTNTLLVGGDNNISFNNGGEVWAWQGADFTTNMGDFAVKNFLPLSVGSIFSFATTYNSNAKNNYLLKSNNMGKSWDSFKTFGEVRGGIISSSVSDENNTVLEVNYSYPSDYVYVEGILGRREISIFDNNSNSLYTGRVIWNEVRDSKHLITIFGSEADSVIPEDVTYVFAVYPFKVNTMVESHRGTLFFGTNQGLYYDVDTMGKGLNPEGIISSVGDNGIVGQIDITGKIISIQTNQASGNSVVSLTSENVIRAQGLIGKSLYVTDANPVEKYDIVDNGSFSVGGDSTIEIDGTLTSVYVGKRFTVVGDSTRVYVNFDLPVSDGQFDDGTLYITSDENNNIGKSYAVKSNTEEYVDLKSVIVPVSTFETSQEKTEDLIIGQNVRLINSTGRIILWVSLDGRVRNNAFEGLLLKMTDPQSTTVSTNLSIYSNAKNSITLDPFSLSGGDEILAFNKGEPFYIGGGFFEQMPVFNNMMTSNNSDHYHNTEMANVIVTGDIGSFTDYNNSYVTFEVSNDVNFDNAIIQSQGDLLENAKIVFTNIESYNLRYVSEVVSHTSTTITVRLKSSSYWNFTEYDIRKISEGWNWEIDATNYGYTEGITYKNFVTASSKVVDSVVRGTSQIELESASGFSVGDKIRIQDDTLSFEDNQIKSFAGSVTIDLLSPVTRTFFETKNPQVKVLSDTFSNTHIHQIRNNEVQVLAISAYLDNGYSVEHSHQVFPLILDISVLLNRSNELILAGSSSKVYNSTNNGVSWNSIVDLNNSLEGGDPVEGVSSAAFQNNNMVVGSINGNVFVQVG